MTNLIRAMAGAGLRSGTSSPGCFAATFPYRLEMSVCVCGDGDPTQGDDGNRTAGDGCDADCEVEAGP